MKFRKHIVLLSIGLVLLLVGYRVASGQSFPPLLPPYQQGSAFKYVIETSPHTGTVRAVVQVNWDDSGAVQRYQQANAARVQTLLSQKNAALVPVQITFKQPLPLTEVVRLVEETGLAVESYTQVGRTAAGERWTRTTLASEWPLSQAVTSTAVRDHRVEKDHQINFAGIMILKGQVPATHSGLGRWLQDPRVYLADTTAVEVIERIQQNLLYIGKPVDAVTLETPFWNLAW
jgi:hypothetical protein